MSRPTALIVATAAVIAGLALSGCSAAGTGAGSGSGTGSAGSSASSAPAPKAPGLNTPVKAGSFEYIALGVKEAGTTVGTSPLTQNAQGTFVRVDLKVANTGDKPQTFIVNYVKLVDTAGKTYDADPTATLYAATDATTWIAAINPGNSVQGPVLFDVPAGTEPASVTVSDNAFSAGETIELR